MKIDDVSSSTTNAVLGSGPFPRRGFVIHTTDGMGSLAWLQGDSARSGRPASADYLIARDGKTYGLCPEGKYTYHAGESAIRDGASAGSIINRTYIGIELENHDHGGQCITDRQYQACAELIRRLAQEHGMSPIEVYGHGNIALPFGRRSDPVRFDYGKLFYYAAHPTAFMLA